jgi:hypothetical protein
MHAASPPALVAPAPCHSSWLRVGLGRGQGAAGTIYVPLVFRNASRFTCSLLGYPGVSSVAGADGHRVGAPAARDHATPVRRVVLAPGARASALFAEAQPLNYPRPRCRPVQTLGLRIYPPNQRAALFLPWRHLACSTTLVTTRVRAVVRGTTGT